MKETGTYHKLLRECIEEGTLINMFCRRSTQSDGLPHTDISDDNHSDILLSTSQLAWLEQSDDTKRLLASDPLCTEFSNVPPDGLEPGEVVFDDTGVVPVAVSSAKTGGTSAHNLYNSYAFNPWKRFQGVLGSSVSAVFERDSLLQSERRHLRLALDDKMREVRELTCNIQKAYETIDELRRLHGGLLHHVEELTESGSDVDELRRLHGGLLHHVEELASNMTESGNDVDAILEQELILDCGVTEVSDQGLDSCLEQTDVDHSSSHDDNTAEANMLQVLEEVVKCDSSLNQHESVDARWTNNQLMTSSQFQAPTHK